MSSENSLSFFGAGGHSHDGVNSTLIDTRRYSLFDFSLGYKGSQTRINTQSTNQSTFEEYIIRIVNQQVLQPAGLNLDPDTLNGKVIRANTITATEIQANTITANQIASNTITANELTSDIILVNNIISSSDFDEDNGWLIASNGTAVFNGIIARGTLTAGVDSTIGGWTADSDRLYKETGQNIISLRASDSPDSAPAVEIFTGDSLYYNECRLLSFGISFENFDNPNTLSAIYEYAGVALDDHANSRSISLTASGLTVFGTSTQSTVGSNELSTTGPVIVGTDQSILTSSFSVAAGSTTMRLGNFNNIFEYLGKPSSSIIYKENVQDIKDPLSIVKKIRPRQFTWKPSDPSNEDEVALKQLDTSFGFIVEELVEDDRRLLCWESPREKAGKGIQSIEDLNEWTAFYWRESDMIALLTAAVKELIVKIDNLESRLQALEDV